MIFIPRDLLRNFGNHPIKSIQLEEVLDEEHATIFVI